jgi:hypothetical protein
MNDYGALWPFWGGDGVGNCGPGDPELPVELANAARAWAARFNDLFDEEAGWPDRATADSHRSEGGRLSVAVQAALPEHEVTFDYWERRVRDTR